MNSIVFVNFECNESTKVVAQKIWQYDYGQILRIQGLNLPAAVEIHFSLQKTGGVAKRRIGVTRDGVTDVVIPDFILMGEGIERDYTAYAFIYLSTEEYGQTEHRIELNITSRPEPEGSSKEEDTSFGAIMDAVNKIAEQNGQGVSDEKIAEAVNAYMEENPVKGTADAVQYISQNLTKEQQTQARSNIGAASAEEFSQLSDAVNDHESRIKAVENNTSVSGNGATTAQANSLWNVLKKTAFVEPLTDEEITALKTAWGITDSGEVEPDEPEEPDVPEVTLTSISATYTGGDVLVGTSVNDLTGIVVTATYSDGSTKNVTGYTLSGTITEGTNTITVSYGGKTDTFIVTGVAESGGDEPDIPETGVSNETTWTSGVPYTFDAVMNEYVNETNGVITHYDKWNRTPYLYCKGASNIRVVVNVATGILEVNNHYNCFYDENKNFITGFSYGEIDYNTVGAYKDITIPDNATYFIASHKAGVIGESDIVRYALEFVPYE